jgi:CubicO group peptidase (beta-lactamase class C family)
MIAVLAASLLALAPGAARAGAVEDEVNALIAKRVVVDPRLLGVVIALERGSERAVVGWGTSKPDGDTVFEIGSVTKVFTARLLVDLVERGQAALDDPAESLRPNAKMPRSASGSRFTLRHLAEHRSGLPRLPDNMLSADPMNPYADYTPALLDAFLSAYALSVEPGTKLEYSNIGYGLLGALLAEKAGVDYASLVSARLAGPLGMTRTAVAWTGPMAKGHILGGDPASNWDLNALAGAGALKSTANDLLKFVSNAAAKPGAPLGWIDEGFIWHNGQTGGFSSFIGFNRATGTKVIVLSNVSVSIDDVGRHLLDASRPLESPPPGYPEVPVVRALLDEYTGRYELAPDAVITIRRDGDGLTAQLTGQPAFRIFASSQMDFLAHHGKLGVREAL